jgi:hypothetical protein
MQVNWRNTARPKQAGQQPCCCPKTVRLQVQRIQRHAWHAASLWFVTLFATAAATIAAIASIAAAVLAVLAAIPIAIAAVAIGWQLAGQRCICWPCDTDNAEVAAFSG